MKPEEAVLKKNNTDQKGSSDLPEENGALSQSDARLLALTRATSDVIYRMSPDWKKMFRLDGRDFLSDTGQPIDNWIEKYILPEDRNKVWNAISEAIREKSIFQLEHRILRADGTQGWTFSRAVPIMNDRGEIIEWFGAATDITKRKDAEELLKLTQEESEKRKRLYEAVTASTPDLIYVFDLEYRFTYANEALLKMWGRPWNESIGKGLRDLGYEEWHATMHEKEIDQVVATKKPIRGEVSFPHAVFGRRMYDYIFVPVLNQHGEVEAVAGTTRDITEIKQAEEARKVILEQLEKRVEERTRELHRSNEDLQQFAHVASHDLKEPVRKIQTFGYSLKEELDNIPSEKAKNYIERILSSAERMSKMVEGVLTYSSLNTLPDNFEPVDLNKVIQDIEQDLEIAIEQRGAQIRYDQLPIIEGIEILIYQLFNNLLNNALKFSKENQKPVIKISSEITRSSGHELAIITVSDNGIGFDAEFADKIFETFTRLNPRSKYEGTGLGLSLCKKIVERHRGSIKATARINEGASFRISIPVKQNT